MPPGADVAHLRDPAFLVRALRYRSARLLHTLAARLRKHSRRLGEFKVGTGAGCGAGLVAGVLRAAGMAERRMGR